MEGLIWGVAAMIVKDTFKTQYVKGRDYERNVRQAYRDLDNLQISMDHIKTNCQEGSLADSHAMFVKRAERQHRDSFRTLKKHYPRNPSLARLIEYSSTPGAEMHLLDIQKEASQTAKGLGDLLAEIRFAKIGGGDKDDKDNDKEKDKDKDKPSTQRIHDMARYEYAVSDGSSSPRSMYSLHSSASPPGIRPSSIHSPDSSLSSSRSGSSRRHSSSSRHRSKYLRERERERDLLPSSFWARSEPLSVITENIRGREREQALDNLQYGVDNVTGACDKEHEFEAMEYLEHALGEVLRLQKAQGFTGSQVDEDLGDAVEDLDDALRGLVDAKNEKEKKYALKSLSHALEDVDTALYRRRKHKDLTPEHCSRQVVPEKVRARKGGSHERSRRSSMY